MAVRLTTLEEFALDRNLRPEETAGFKAWLKGKRCASDDEWNALYERYVRRSLK